MLKWPVLRNVYFGATRQDIHSSRATELENTGGRLSVRPTQGSKFEKGHAKRELRRAGRCAAEMGFKVYQQLLTHLDVLHSKSVKKYKVDQFLFAWLSFPSTS